MTRQSSQEITEKVANSGGAAGVKGGGACRCARGGEQVCVRAETDVCHRLDTTQAFQVREKEARNETVQETFS